MNPSPSPSGLLIIDKPLGRTSMNICSVIRAKLRRGGSPKGIKVGHGGTLDPLATGVLVILIGKATRLCNQIMAGRKRYLATIDLAHTSATHDHESEFVPVVPQRDPPAPTPEELSEVLRGFVGEIEQTPPAHSAINVGGTRAYELARKGHDVPVRARTVRIDSIEILSYRWPYVQIDVRSGKGTYLRSLARDLGVALRTGGTLEALVRTEASPFTIDAARSFHDLPEALVQADLLPVPAASDLPPPPAIRGPSFGGERP